MKVMIQPGSVSNGSSGSGSLGKETVDVVVGDLRERRLEIDEGVLLPFHFLSDLLENLVELACRAPDAQPDEPQRGSFVEDDDQNHALGDDRNVDRSEEHTSELQS